MATMSLDKQQSIYILTLHNGDHANALNKVVLEEYQDFLQWFRFSLAHAAINRREKSLYSST